jgi:hypothetical protein
MKAEKHQKYYWGIGIENETYMQFEEGLQVSGEFIHTKIGCERYSIDYRKCYKSGLLDQIVQTGFDPTKMYRVSRMINSHSLEKVDVNYQHKTLLEFIKSPDEDEAKWTPVPNPEYLGQSILDVFLAGQPHNIWSMVTQANNPMGCVFFDGDSIEFVTKYFENRTISESCEEIKTTKKLFFDKINESEVINGKLKPTDYNIGLNMFMSNQQNIVLFNNGTYHFHITLPTLTENSRIVDYPAFEKRHANAIYMLQWFEPFFISTLGSPDIMAVISNKHDFETPFALGSMRSAMSRYTGVGSFHKSMAKGKILTYNVDEFRKLLKFDKSENKWWRDQIDAEMGYHLLSDLGLDFNQEKMYQSGFEFRCFDEFPESYLNDVLLAIILICEHADHVPDILWGHDSLVWNNLVVNTLKNGYLSEINDQEKQEVLDILQLPNANDPNAQTLKMEFDAIVRLDAFFFKILAVLHEMYKDANSCIDAMLGHASTAPPLWNNYNQFQVEQHQIQLNPLA